MGRRCGDRLKEKSPTRLDTGGRGVSRNPRLQIRPERENLEGSENWLRFGEGGRREWAGGT